MGLIFFELCDEQEKTPLFYAVSKNYFKMAQCFIKTYKAPIDAMIRLAAKAANNTEMMLC